MPAVLSILLQGIVLVKSCTAPVPQDSLTIQSGRADTVYSISTRELKSSHIPDSVFRMQYLKKIFIQGMDCDYGDHTHCWAISEIPAEIKNLTALTELHLTVNAIQSLPPELAACKQLRVLNLADNPGLQSIDVIAQLTSLEILQLYGCNLFRLPANIASLTNLKELGLAGNNLDEKEKARIRKALPHCRIIF